MQVIKLVVVSSDDVVRNDIQMHLQPDQTIKIVGVCSTHSECEEYLRHRRAKVLLLDDVLPGCPSPIETVSELRRLYPWLPIIILSDNLSEHYVQHLLDLGIAGFIYRDDRLVDTLVDGIKTVAVGYVYRSPKVPELPYSRAAAGPLNRADHEVLRLLAKGYTIREIAARLEVGVRSVYRIRSRLREHFAVRTID